MATIYQRIATIGQRFVAKHTLFKVAFNLSPMYRRTTARVLRISPDLHRATVKLPISWKNRNYVGSIFGGSLYAAVDPIYMIQLLNILGDDYVVWDKAAEIRFRIPAREDLFADFEFTVDEVASIRETVDVDGEFVFDKEVELRDEARTRVFCVVQKTLYVATKEHYRAKREVRREGGG